MKTLKLWCLSLLACLLISSALPPSAYSQVTQIIGAAVGPQVPPVQPCATFGFVEEAQLTLPTGFNTGVMIRVVRERVTGIPYNNIGYAITEDATSQRIAVFDLTTMTLRASAILDTFPGKYRAAGRVQGDIDTDSRLYVFREARNGGGSCAGGAGNNCESFARFIENATFAEAITGPDATVNIDDARDGGGGTYLILNAEVTPTNGNRRFENFSKSSLGKLGNGTEFGHMGFGKLSRLFNGNLYGITNGNTANGLRVPSGSATSNGTFSVTASFGARLPAAIYGLTGDQATPLQQIATESDQTGGVQAFRAYNNQSDLVNCCTGNYDVGGTNGAAIFMGSFYDATNNKVFSARVDGANEELIRTTPGPDTFTVEATLNCVNCNYNGGSNTGSQVIDYAPQKARLFTISTASPAVINRIRVCATGGPPA